MPTPSTDSQSAPDVKSALTGFAADFRGFRTDLERRLAEQSTRLDALDRKAIAAARPALSATRADPASPHQKAFAAYVRQGDEDRVRHLDLEEKALTTAVAAEGGVLVDPQTATRIETVLRASSSLRSVARIVQVEATAYDALVDHTEMGAAWITESSAISETATPNIDRISIPLHELSATPKASQRLLDDSAFDVEGWLAERIAARFARAENAAFISGDGVDKPKGILAHPVIDNASWAWGTLGTIPSGADGAFAASDPGDALVTLVYALPAGYRANAAFLMNSATAGSVRKLKDADGRYLWAEGLTEGQPARLLGYPVLIAEDMPDIASASHAIAFGDMRAAYTIAERPDLRVLRDPYSAKPHVLFYATRRVGGDITDFAALKLLQFSA